MAVVGPSGSVKTDLIFSILQSSSFYPRFFTSTKSSRTFLQLCNVKYHKTSSSNILDWYITKKLSNCLLAYDGSCEELFNDKEFVKIATSGRHRKLRVIYLKHYLFQQSKWSRTIDLNITHIILFKSLQDIQQIEYFGKQLNCLQLLKDAYKLASAQPYGHLIVDLELKTSQGSRFFSQLLVPIRQFSIFLRRKPLLHQLRMKKRHKLMLKRRCVSSNPKMRDKRIFLAQDIDFIWFLSDCNMNVLSGVVSVNKNEVQKS